MPEDVSNLLSMFNAVNLTFLRLQMIDRNKSGILMTFFRTLANLVVIKRFLYGLSAYRHASLVDFMPSINFLWPVCRITGAELLPPCANPT